MKRNRSESDEVKPFVRATRRADEIGAYVQDGYVTLPAEELSLVTSGLATVHDLLTLPDHMLNDLKFINKIHQ